MVLLCKPNIDRNNLKGRGEQVCVRWIRFEEEYYKEEHNSFSEQELASTEKGVELCQCWMGRQRVFPLLPGKEQLCLMWIKSSVRISMISVCI